MTDDEISEKYTSARVMTSKEVVEFLNSLEKSTLIEAEHLGIPEQFLFVGKTKDGHILRYAGPEHKSFGRKWILYNPKLLDSISIICPMTEQEFSSAYHLPD